MEENLSVVEYELIKLAHDMLAKHVDNLSVMSAEFVIEKLGDETPDWVKVIAGGNPECFAKVAEVATEFYFLELIL